jgi:IS30 family transposase
LKLKRTVSQIADDLGIKYNTLYKEIKRGMVIQRDSELVDRCVYMADYAQMVVERNMSNRGRSLKIGAKDNLVSFIERKIKHEKYSPLAVVLEYNKMSEKSKNGIESLPVSYRGLYDFEKQGFADMVCFKTIYNYLDKGLFENISNGDLPVKKEDKRKKKSKKRSVALKNLKGDSISNRPKKADDRSQYGHWEVDTVYGAVDFGKSCLLVLTERKFREEILVKIPDRKSESVVNALDLMERNMGLTRFRKKFKSFTLDNGVEFLDIEGIENSKVGKGKRVKTYFCHPYSSWERGSNENANRLVRRFFPKGTDFGKVTNSQVKMVEVWINNYPRKQFGGLSSKEAKEAFGISA